MHYRSFAAQIRRARSGALLLGLALGGCSDRVSPLHPSAEGARRNVSTTEHPEWRGYWRNATELWVYDMTPEVGIQTFFGEDAKLQRIRNAGMRMVRYNLPWGDEVACPGCFGGAMQSAVNNNIVPLMVVSGSRDAAMQLTNPANSSERNTVYQAFANHMVDLMRRYPNVSFFQLWNETDAMCEPGKFFNGSNSHGNSTYLNPNRYVQGRNYADMLKVVYPRIKAEASAQGRRVWVVTAGFTGEEGISSGGCNGGYALDVNSWEFVRGMYANGGKDYFDIFAIHAYGLTVGSYHSFLETTNIVTYNLHTSWGDPNRPLWVTEFGTSAANSMPLMDPNRDQSQDGVAFDNIQRDWYTEALGVQRDAGTMQKIFGFTFATPEGGSVPNSGIAGADPWDYGLGIFRGDQVTPRPAYDYLLSQSATNSLAESRGTRTGVFRIRTSGQVPSVHPYHYEGDVIVVENVQVNSLYPTIIPMRWP